MNNTERRIDKAHTPHDLEKIETELAQIPDLNPKNLCRMLARIRAKRAELTGTIVQLEPEPVKPVKVKRAKKVPAAV